jgi:hypothetical protein
MPAPVSTTESFGAAVTNSSAAKTLPGTKD